MLVCPRKAGVFSEEKSHQNRETSGAPWPERERGRSAKAPSHTAEHARSRGLGPRHIIDEPDELRRAIFGGASGEKGAGQGEHRLIQHSPDTVRESSVPGIERCASSHTARHSSKVGAVCGNAARSVLCGGN
jgi:hypothetical protein